MERSILNGWKEISSHLERGARTAQRWELQFGMPVHRPASKRGTAVVAFADELDLWLSRNRHALDGEPQNGNDEMNPVRLRETLLRLQIEAKDLSVKLMRLERRLQETVNSDGNELPQRDVASKLEAHS